MPTLIQNHRKSVVETRLAKFYSIVNQAVKMAESEYGDVTGWEPYERIYEKDEQGKPINSKPIPNVEYFNKYFRPYLKFDKVETINNAAFVVAYFNDGSLATFSGSVIAFYPNAKDFIIDERETGENGRVKADCGSKYFLFHMNSSSQYKGNELYKYHYGKGVEPYKIGWDGTRNFLLNHQTAGCKKDLPATEERSFCTALIQLNGWKIPDDYPIKF